MPGKAKTVIASTGPILESVIVVVMRLDVRVCVQAKAGITDDIIEVLTATSADLSKGRRKRPMPPGLAAPGSFDHYKMLSSHPLHKTSEVRTLQGSWDLQCTYEFAMSCFCLATASA